MDTEETILFAIKEFMWERGLRGKVEGSWHEDASKFSTNPLPYLEIRRTNHVFHLVLLYSTQIEVTTHRRRPPEKKRKDAKYDRVETTMFDLNDPDSLQALYEFMQSKKRR